MLSVAIVDDYDLYQAFVQVMVDVDFEFLARANRQRLRQMCFSSLQLPLSYNWFSK